MKKILILVLAFACCGCSAPQFLTKNYVTDFRNYQEKGFLISPNFGGFTYESVGMVKVVLKNVFWLGEESDSCILTMENDDDAKKLMRFYGIDKYTVYDYATVKLVEQALNMGANAILDYRINENFVYAGASSYNAIEVQGFAVKLAE